MKETKPLPRDCKKVVEAIDLVPFSWTYVNGYLTAPYSLHESGLVVPNVRLLVSSKPFRVSNVEANDPPYESFIDHEQIGKVKIEKPFSARVNEVILYGKLQSSLFFDKVSVSGKEVIIDDLKELAKNFIEKGYKGRLSFHSTDNPDPSKVEVIRFSHCRDTIEIEVPGEAGLNGLESVVEKILKLVPKPQIEIDNPSSLTYK